MTMATASITRGSCEDALFSMVEVVGVGDGEVSGTEGVNVGVGEELMGSEATDIVWLPCTLVKV
jgi:hypothetical protein